MRKFEMYLLFILSTALLPACSGFDKEQFEEELLTLHNNERDENNDALKKHDIELNYTFNLIKENVIENRGDDICCIENYCFIFVQITDITSMTTQQVFDKLKNVHSENRKYVNFNQYLRNNTESVSFEMIDNKKKKKERGHWFVAVYFPVDGFNTSEIICVGNDSEEFTPFESTNEIKV